MHLLIEVSDVGPYQDAIDKGTVLVVSEGLPIQIQQIARVMGQVGGEDVLIELLLNLLARLIQVTVASDGASDEVPIDEDLVDRLVMDAYVGHVAMAAVQEVQETAAKVKQLDQDEFGEQSGSSLLGENENGTQEAQDREG